ncbi:hypothetical protein GTQ40_11145 [Flavobacteriaceae bacterium R38]|nr:hypothetical protein [Flavobacteriaceae bacterium R38]
MNNHKIEAVLAKLNNIQLVDNHPGYWVILLDNYQLHIITDEKSNRMRIISPIIDVKDLKENQLTEAMQAHFHKALDIKYAIYDERVWSVYTHYLEELTKKMFIDAISQVYLGASNFGESYSSSNLFFGAGDN